MTNMDNISATVETAGGSELFVAYVVISATALQSGDIVAGRESLTTDWAFVDLRSAFCDSSWFRTRCARLLVSGWSEIVWDFTAHVI